ncbi:MAG TPA: PqqD family protein [Candidatus Paceibacterota bacterium]|nr:PqqD family protein [Candidatus Paceibacterota bacterium]
MNSYAAKGMNVSCRTIDGEAFIFDQETRLLLKLDEVGSFIWDQINGLRTINQISEICCKTFEGDKEDILSSVKEFIDDLHNKNMVVLSTKPFGKEVISAC